MKFIQINLDGDEPTEKVLPLLTAICGFYGLTVTRCGGAVVADLVASARDIAPSEPSAASEHLMAGGDLDDPAAIMAAARGGAAPLAPTGAPSGAAVDPSTTAPEGAPASSPTLDSAGLPWDERIHSGSRAKIKDGTWRKRSKLDDGVYDSILAELRLEYPEPEKVIAPPPAPPTGDGTLTFPAVIARLHAGYARTGDEVPVDKATVSALLAEFGITGLEQLGKRPDLFETFVKRIGV